jgi:hypothetical protein
VKPEDPKAEVFYEIKGEPLSTLKQRSLFETEYELQSTPKQRLFYEIKNTNAEVIF